VIASADVVVVGSGAFGASVAYHLARRGARVAVLERSGLASQTSPRAAGLSSQVRATPALTRLAQRAVVKLAAFADETGQPLRFTQSGFQDPTIRVAEHRGGLPTLTMDDRYLVGPLPGVAGAWVMSGCCVGGLSVSPALGEAIGEWILDGAPALDLSEIAPARFAGHLPDEAELRERCRRAYATHYRAGGDSAAAR